MQFPKVIRHFLIFLQYMTTNSFLIVLFFFTNQ
jgi:hypothetical protein